MDLMSGTNQAVISMTPRCTEGGRAGGKGRRQTSITAFNSADLTVTGYARHSPSGNGGRQRGKWLRNRCRKSHRHVVRRIRSLGNIG